MDEILRLLAGAQAVSGEEIGARLGISRAAVWKKIEALRAQGYAIQSAGRSGYCLVKPANAIDPVYWQPRLTTRWAGREAVYFPQLGSTNAEAKRLAIEGAAHGTLVLADRQTAGRGRRGRDWESPPGSGLWMTLLLRPAVQAERIPSLALAVALAVADACEAVCGAQVGVKWPNDALIGGRKVCGILLEMAADLDGAQWVIAGVGLNVGQREQDFPPELRESATSLRMACGGREFDRAEVLLALLGALEVRCAAWEGGGVAALREDYLRRSVTLGKRVNVIAPAEQYAGEAIDIDDTGALLVRREGGEICRVLAADVSVRGECGYV